MKKEELLALLRQYMGEAGAHGDKLIEAIIKQINAGLPLSRAIDKALAETGFTAGYFNRLIDTICTAALLGYGVKVPSIAMKNAVREYALSDVWAHDKMKLSKRLHGTSKQMRRTIIGIISTAMRKTKTVKQMATDLYDGYNSGEKVLRGAELPEYLERLMRAARSAAGGDRSITREFNLALKQAQKQIEKMPSDKALKAAYQKIVDASLKLNQKAIDKAAWVAVQEKARFYADRIAVTESSRAWSDSFYAKTYDDDLVIGYGWRLSSRHPRVDICDFHAKVDHYGMGPGNYPKDRMPPHPAHPLCTCNLIVLYKGEVTPGKFNPDAGTAWLKEQTLKNRREMFGIDGAKKFDKDGKWQKILRYWNGHADPKPNPKLRKILKEQGSKQAQGKSGIIRNDNSVIPESKLTKYALDKNHAGGGRDKAIAFELALGYNQSNYKDLMQQVYDKLNAYPAVFKRTDKYGDRYEIVMDITGPNGKTAKVLTGWLLKDEKARLTTIYVDK